MSNVLQHTVALNSRNQLRNAERLARDWAVAHAGNYRGQAIKDLGGSLPFREWKNENLTIRMAKFATEGFLQVQLFAIHFDFSTLSEPYTAYVVTYTSPRTEQVGGYCITVASVPDTVSHIDLPWDDRAGPAGLEKLIQTINAANSPETGDSDEPRNITTIDDLFTMHDTALVLTEEGRVESEFEELADMHSDWAGVVSIDASEQLALSRQLPDHQLPAWVRAKIALFSRYADQDGHRLLMTESDLGKAMSFVDAKRERATNDLAGRNAIAVLKILESVSALQTLSTSTERNDSTDDQVEPATPSCAKDDEAGTTNGAAMQQRIFLLEDQLSDAERTISELQERLALYENYEMENLADGGEDAENEPETASIVDSNRHTTVLAAITDPERYPRLRFLTNCEKPLASYGKPRPNGVEIVAALDAINKLAQAWHNTPTRNIGTWSNYFIHLPGWKHADDESESTMSRFGAKRSFSDQERGRKVSITRHLTYQGSGGGLQIYFDKDDITDTFLVGYIGEHLPYATSPS